MQHTNVNKIIVKISWWHYQKKTFIYFTHTQTHGWQWQWPITFLSLEMDRNSWLPKYIKQSIKPARPVKQQSKQNEVKNIMKNKKRIMVLWPFLIYTKKRVFLNGCGVCSLCTCLKWILYSSAY